jgi:hypothetical protein
MVSGPKEHKGGFNSTTEKVIPGRQERFQTNTDGLCQRSQAHRSSDLDAWVATTIIIVGGQFFTQHGGTAGSTVNLTVFRLLLIWL